MKQTAIEQAIAKINESVINERYVLEYHQEYDQRLVIDCGKIIQCANNSIKILTELLPVEQQQLKDAWEDGARTAADDISSRI